MGAYQLIEVQGPSAKTSVQVERKAALRDLVLESLRVAGFDIQREEVQAKTFTKDEIRRLHEHRRAEVLLRERQFILDHEDDLIENFADGDEVEIHGIYPKLVPVKSDIQRRLFRYASMLWSVPVSQGYGRRMRYLILDIYNEKLLGLLSLCDPIIGIRVRDDWVGWTLEQKARRLWHIMDANVLGSVPPYNQLLGGKLIATLALANEVRRDFRRRYGGVRALISGRKRPGHLVLVTTMSALGRSSMLDRLRHRDATLWEEVGPSEGWGHFHLSGEVFSKLREYLRERGDPIWNAYKWGNGPNWRMRVIRHALVSLGLPPTLLRHGVKRYFYAAPLAENFKEFMRGEVNSPEYYDWPLEDLFDFFSERYLVPRAKRRDGYRNVRADDLRLSRVLSRVPGGKQ